MRTRVEVVRFGRTFVEIFAAAAAISLLAVVEHNVTPEFGPPAGGSAQHAAANMPGHKLRGYTPVTRLTAIPSGDTAPDTWLAIPGRIDLEAQPSPPSLIPVALRLDSAIRPCGPEIGCEARGALFVFDARTKAYDSRREQHRLVARESGPRTRLLSE